jgi:hypothetical protein
MGDAVRKSFGVATALNGTTATGPCSTVEAVVTVTAGTPFDALVLQEDLSLGQVVLGYTIELQSSATGAWTLLANAHGKTVGSKLIDTIPPPSASTVSAHQQPPSPPAYSAARFRCTDAIGGQSAVVTLSRFSLHKQVPPPVVAKQYPLRSYWSSANNDTAPCALRDGGSCSTFTGAKCVPAATSS